MQTSRAASRLEASMDVSPFASAYVSLLRRASRAASVCLAGGTRRRLLDSSQTESASLGRRGTTPPALSAAREGLCLVHSEPEEDEAIRLGSLRPCGDVREAGCRVEHRSLRARVTLVINECGRSVQASRRVEQIGNGAVEVANGQHAPARIGGVLKACARRLESREHKLRRFGAEASA
eukprot:6209440-Pleurochrysis_carterae.AAC.3